ncbi:Fic family protein [uncultured Aquimarina sp.]|uniref:Fic family protein n=1 Tax=uncultured Aquimarina sp. TaxID=575652 RepID=UPI0026233F6E|nr:Fic family protein [uncultured Aquimarina sp.]
MKKINEIDECRDKIQFYNSYDPVISIIRDNFQLHITQHLASLKSPNRTDPKEDIRKSATSKGTELENSTEIQKEIYLDIGRKYSCTLFMFDMVNKPIEESDVKLFYEILFNVTEYRTDEVLVQRQDGEIHQFTKPLLIEEKVENLIEWLKSNREKSDLHPLEIVTKFHYDFIEIHPFLDGNGRIGRLLMNILLMNYGYLPILIQQSESLRYYEALQSGDDGDTNALLEFFCDKQLETQNDFISSAEYLSIVAKYELEEQLKQIKGTEKCFVLTEDTKTGNLIKVVFASNGFNLTETSFISYEGCSQIGSVTLFSIFVKQKLPHIEIVVHRDRDYLTDQEIIKLEDNFSKIDVKLFITDGTDIESHLVCSKHINKCHPEISIDEAQKIIDESIRDVELKSIDLFRKREFGEKHSKKSSHLDQALIDIYNSDKFRFSHGKTMYKSVKSKIQKTIKQNANLELKSEYLLIEKLNSVGTEIW